MADAIRITQLSRTTCSLRNGKNNEASAGITVMDTINEPNRHSSTVSAIGKKSLPALPSNIKIGR